MDDQIKFTEEQASIISSDAPLKRVIACAGSGKTRVITSNIIKVVRENRCRPGEILALTFTRNAAENMRRRIRDNFVGKYYFDTMDIHTFNSFGNEIISENSFELGLGRDFRLISASQSWQILYEVFSDFHFNHLEVGKSTGKFIKDLLTYIEYLKNNLITVGDFRQYMKDRKKILSGYKSSALRSCEEGLSDKQQELFEIYLRYEDIKTVKNYIDYADQVFLPYYLLLEKNLIRRRYQTRYKYIFVDEFQDTNIAQAHLLSLLFRAGKNNMIIVGDDDQGIYSFRGACIDNILDFHNWEVFNSTKVTDFYLTGNFRSGTSILRAAERLISHNSLRFKKKFRSLKKDHRSAAGFLVKKTLREEAEQTAEIIEWMAGNGIKLKDMAIISRRKRFGPFIRELESRNIRYELIGGKNFLFEPEILFLVSWLKVIEDPGDELSVLYLLKSIKYRIGDRDIHYLKKGYNGHAKVPGMVRILADTEVGKDVSSEARKRIKDFIKTLRLYMRKSHEFKLNELVSYIYEDSGLSYYLKSKFGWVSKRAIRNVEKLIRIASDFEQAGSIGYGLKSFITYIEDFNGADYDISDRLENTGGDAVRVMSIHAAKGLEFRVVFLPMLWKKDYSGKYKGKISAILPAELRKDGLLWSQKKDFSSEKSFRQALEKIREEEERRIFYVACSRAKEILVLSHSEFEDDGENTGERRRPREIVPYFYELAGDTTALKALNTEALDYIKKAGGNSCRIEDCNSVFGFALKKTPLKKHRRIVYDWSGAEKRLYDFLKKEKSTGLPGFERKIKSLAGSTAGEMGLLPGGMKNSGKTTVFYSLTELLDNIDCSSLYKWKYVFLIPEPSNEMLLLGDKMHRYIERITGFKYSYPSAFIEVMPGVVKKSPLKDHIKNFMESRFLSFNGLRELRLEQLFYWKLDDYFITGKMDRIDFLNDGRVEIIDYKLSGGSHGGEINERYHNQLLVYAAAVSEIYGIPLSGITGTLYYLKENKEERLLFDRKELKDLKEKLLHSINSIKDNHDMPCPGRDCADRCSYYKLCSGGGVAFP